MSAAVDFRALDALLNGRDIIDAACPWCGPDRREVINQRRKVLRLWSAPGFISYHCARCAERGFVRDNECRPVNREALQRARAIVAERERIEVERRRNTGLSLYRNRQPITDTIAEKYLRQGRGITCPLQSTLGFLSARDGHPPSLIAAFGIPDELEPGVLSIADEAVRGVHLTKLRPDGDGKADVDPNKIMIGRALGWPIVLAPMNDLLGLAVCEGIEDGLSIHQATGLGCWAAGSAHRMPALADMVPSYCDCVTVVADTDETGQHNATLLAERLNARGIRTEIVPSGAQS